MKRIIPSFLLAVLASSSLLFAQSENSREASNTRLEETVRQNQSLDTSLQPVAYSDQKEQAKDDSSQEVGNVDSDTIQSTITKTQYCDFLNAVASIKDPHHLYNSKNNSDSINCRLKVVISTGITKHYHYSVIPGKEEEPITDISLLDGMRYCNWLENGQPKGTQEAEATEDGVYTLKGNNVIAINPNATHCLVNPEGSQINGVVIISSLSNLPSTTNLLEKSPDRGLCIVSTTAPQLMMNPATEEAGEKLVAGLKGLGVTAQEGRVASSVRGASSSTVLQAVGLGYAACSSSSSSSSFQTTSVLTKEQEEKQSIENLLSKKMEEHKVKLADYYKKADEQWNKYHDAWEGNLKAKQENKKAQVILQWATKELEEATTKCKDNEKNPTKTAQCAQAIAKGAEKLSIAFDALAGIIPQAKIGSVAVNLIQGIANQINQELIYGDQTRANARLNSATENDTIAKKKVKETYEKLKEALISAKKSEAEAQDSYKKSMGKFAEEIEAPLFNEEEKWKTWANNLIDSDPTIAKKKGGWFSGFGSKKSSKEQQLDYKSASQKQAKWIHKKIKDLWEKNFQNFGLNMNIENGGKKPIDIENEYQDAIQDDRKAGEGFIKSRKSLKKAIEKLRGLAKEHEQCFKNQEEEDDEKYENILDDGNNQNSELLKLEKEIEVAENEVDKAYQEWLMNKQQHEDKENNLLEKAKKYNGDKGHYINEEGNKVPKSFKDERMGVANAVFNNIKMRLEGNVAKALECFRAEEENLGNKNALQIIEELKQQYEKHLKEAEQKIEIHEGKLTKSFFSGSKERHNKEIGEANNCIQETEGKLAELDLVKERIIKIEKLKLKAKEALEDAYKNHKLALDVADCESLDKIKKTSKAMESSNNANQASSLVQQSLNEFDVWHKAINKINKAQRTHKDSMGKQTEAIDETASSFVAELKPWIENESENMRREIESMNDLAMCQNDMVQSSILFQIQEISKKARELESLAQVAKEQTKISDSSIAEAEIEVLWNDVIETNKQAQKAWAEVIEKEVADFHAIPKVFEDVWSNAIEEAKNKQKFLQDQIPLCEVRKAENLAEVTRSQAEVSDSIVETDIEALWDKAIERSKQAEESWGNFASNQQDLSAKEDAENSQRLWQAQASWYKAQKAESLAKMAQTKIANSKDLEFKEMAANWKNVLQRLKEFSEAWTEAKEKQKVGYAEALERLKDSWSNLIKDIDTKANVSSIWILPQYFNTFNVISKSPAASSARKDVKFALSEEWRYLTTKILGECRKESIVVQSGIGKSKKVHHIERPLEIDLEVAKNKYTEQIKEVFNQLKPNEIASHKIEAALFENIFERCFSVRPVFVPLIPGQQPIINESIDKLKCFLGNLVGENVYIKAFDTVWSGIIQAEQERSQRILKIKNETFRNANDAWNAFVNSKATESYDDAMKEEVKAKKAYADAVKEEAWNAAFKNESTRTEHTRAAEGAWAGRVSKSAEIIDQAIGKLRQAVQNLGKKVNNVPSFYTGAIIKTEGIHESEYQSAVRDLERAIAIIEADLAAWQTEWPEDFQKEENILAKEYKDFVIKKIEMGKNIDKLEKDFVSTQQKCNRLKDEYIELRSHHDYKGNLIILSQYYTTIDTLNKHSNICDRLNEAQASLLNIEDLNKEHLAINQNVIDNKFAELYKPVAKAQTLFDQILTKFNSFLAVEQEPGRTSKWGREKEANVKVEKIIIEMNNLLGKPVRNATPNQDRLKWNNLVADAYSFLHLACVDVITTYYDFIEAKYRLQNIGQAATNEIEMNKKIDEFNKIEIDKKVDELEKKANNLCEQYKESCRHFNGNNSEDFNEKFEETRYILDGYKNISGKLNQAKILAFEITEIASANKNQLIIDQNNANNKVIELQNQLAEKYDLLKKIEQYYNDFNTAKKEANAVYFGPGAKRGPKSTYRVNFQEKDSHALKAQEAVINVRNLFSLPFIRCEAISISLESLNKQICEDFSSAYRFYFIAYYNLIEANKHFEYLKLQLEKIIESEKAVAQLSQGQHPIPVASLLSFVAPVPIQQPVVSKFVRPGLVQQPIQIPAVLSFIPGVPAQQPITVSSASLFVPSGQVQQPVSSLVPGGSTQQPNVASSSDQVVSVKRTTYVIPVIPPYKKPNQDEK